MAKGKPRKRTKFHSPFAEFRARELVEQNWPRLVRNTAFGETLIERIAWLVDDVRKPDQLWDITEP